MMRQHALVSGHRDKTTVDLETHLASCNSAGRCHASCRPSVTSLSSGLCTTIPASLEGAPIDTIVTDYCRDDQSLYGWI